MVEFDSLVMPESAVHFSLRCCGCDAGDDVGSRLDAETKGWTDIVFDDGLSWNFLGMCPDCLREEAERNHAAATLSDQ